MNSIKTTTLLVLISLITCGLTNPISAQQRDYRFDGRISKVVLENYLSRAVTFAELLNPERTEKSLNGSVEDNIRFLKNIGAHWCWGYDEICWFAHQPEAYRNQWIRQTDPAGFFQMPASRTLADPLDNVQWYYANTRSEKVPSGFNQESTIKSIWSKDHN